MYSTQNFILIKSVTNPSNKTCNIICIYVYVDLHVYVQISAPFRHAFISDHKFSFYNPRLLEKASNKIGLKVTESLNSIIY